MRHELNGKDALRLLANAIGIVSYFESTNEGYMPPCRDVGEYMLQDALHYLAYGDINSARKVIAEYENWLETGHTPWPFYNVQR